MTGGAGRPQPLLGVKMCGSCNPDIRALRVAGRIAECLDMHMVPYGLGDLSLCISACPTACVEEGYPAHAVIRGLRLNGRPCRDENELVRKTVEAIRPLLAENKSTRKGRFESMKQPFMDTERIKTILPHRNPMLMIDTVFECSPMESVEGSLYIDPDWSIFEGHFPGNPVFPGVLSVECMAQASDVMVLTAERYRGREPLFAGIAEAKFRKKISPGDRVTVKSRVLSENAEKAIVTCRAELFLGDQLAAAALITLALR